jgi:hypothetical protein
MGIWLVDRFLAAIMWHFAGLDNTLLISGLPTGWQSSLPGLLLSARGSNHEAGVNNMPYVRDVRKHAWRSILFAAVVLVLWIVNVRIESAEARKRSDEVERLVAELRVLTVEHAGAGWTIEEAAWRDSPAYRQLVSLDVRVIPMLLRYLEQEDESVGRVLAEGIAELGQLNLAEADWRTREAWKSAWDAHVDRAEKQVPAILADQRLTAPEQAAQLAELGAAAIPHLIGDLQTGRGTEASMTAIRQLLGPSYDARLPVHNDRRQWQRWARTHAGDYALLSFKFE